MVPKVPQVPVVLQVAQVPLVPKRQDFGMHVYLQTVSSRIHFLLMFVAYIVIMYLNMNVFLFLYHQSLIVNLCSSIICFLTNLFVFALYPFSVDVVVFLFLFFSCSRESDYIGP